jgi:putative DNA primase/helicase
MLYKGYIMTEGKKSLEKLKGRRKFKSYDEVADLDGYAGVLADDTILVDVDDTTQAEILMNIVEDYQLNCKVLCTSRGKHFLFKNYKKVTKNGNDLPLAIGIHADIKIGAHTSYEVLKINGEDRFCEWDSDEYQELPKYLCPVRASTDFVNMGNGDGRNQALFNYILTLQSNDFTVEETREAIRIMNYYVLKEPLSEDELEVILRDEAFQKPVFYVGSTFLFDKFATYLKNSCHVVKINHQLHIYKDGVYVSGYREIEAAMITLIPNLRKTQRREVLDYMELIVDEVEASDANMIAFKNGIYDIAEDRLMPFSSNMVVTNKIPWNYNPSAYCELADNTLDKLACDDESIRSLLEECIGYCFYRRNELGKAFILTGDKNNGKSTFLDCVKAVMGDDNISALDLKELGDRFSTSMMFGKLANVGDDIGDDFLQGSQVAVFKKIVTGNRIKAERKGQDPFEFNPYVKLLFSANNIPRMKDKTGAVLRRLVIIPFNARFSKTDKDYDPFIKYKLIQEDSMEYLISLGIEGLKRVITNNGFTQSRKVQKELEEYEQANNPIISFIREYGVDAITYEPTNEVYQKYQSYCIDNSLTTMSNTVFSKQINMRLGLEVITKRVNGKVRRIFVPATEEKK